MADRMIPIIRLKAAAESRGSAASRVHGRIRRVFNSEGVEIIRLAYRRPVANAFAALGGLGQV
jgi:hypothetical protein